MAPGRDLRHRTAVRGGGHQALGGTDHGGRVLCGPGQFGCPERAEQPRGRDGPGVRVEEGLRDHGHGRPLRLELASLDLASLDLVGSHPFGLWPEPADLGVRVASPAEHGIQARAALSQRGLHDDRGGILVRVVRSGEEPT